jgi:hypothetical protein
MRKRLLAAARPLHHAASNSRPSFFTITMYFQESAQSLNNLQPTAQITRRHPASYRQRGGNTHVF